MVFELRFSHSSLESTSLSRNMPWHDYRTMNVCLFKMVSLLFGCCTHSAPSSSRLVLSFLSTLTQLSLRWRMREKGANEWKANRLGNKEAKRVRVKMWKWKDSLKCSRLFEFSIYLLFFLFLLCFFLLFIHSRILFFFSCFLELSRLDDSVSAPR